MRASVAFGRSTPRNDVPGDDARANGRRSTLSAVLDKEGGYRIVVTQRRGIPANVEPGERAFTVPFFRVVEPVEWDWIPAVIETATRYMLGELSKESACGGCNVCCYLTYIPVIHKPSRTMCRECAPGLGCKAYKVRPQECREFACTWLASQASADPMAANLRPDRCGVMFMPDTTDGANDLFEVHPVELIDAENARMTEAARDYIDGEIAKGRRAKLITYYYGEAKP